MGGWHTPATFYNLEHQFLGRDDDEDDGDVVSSCGAGRPYLLYWCCWCAGSASQQWKETAKAMLVLCSQKNSRTQPAVIVFISEDISRVNNQQREQQAN